MLWTIIKKEVRENLPWALLGLAVLSLAYIGTLRSQDMGIGEYIPLLRGSLLSATVAIYAIFGAALGLLQTVPEAMRGTYAALVHLPISRGKILLGKALAGAGLYLAAGGIPLIAAVIWVAIPGHYAAPFVLEMAGAITTNLFCGLAFYCAGLLAGNHQGRWYATRGAGLVSALVVLFAIHAVPLFWLAMVIIAAGTLVLYWAAYAQFNRRSF